MKLSPVREVVEGKRVVMVDDSIVRGTTIQTNCENVKRSRSDGSACCDYFTTIKNPCFYGIDTSRRDELIAANNQ